MTKFRCIKGSAAVPVGTILVGELEGERIRLTEDSTVKDEDNKSYFAKGELVPLTGYVWQWESCEGEPDKEELLARFEQAIETYRICTELVTQCDGSDIDLTKATKEYESAKAELLKRLS